MRFVSLTVFLLALCVLSKSVAQSFVNQGVPRLEQYTPFQYGDKGKVWDIKSISTGLVYFAAEKGLMEYDGNTWRCYNGSRGFMRSISIESDSIIYSGSDLDFGIWRKNNLEEFYYTSLYPFSQEKGTVNEEFWDVHQIGGYAVFISFDGIYLYNRKQVTKISSPEKITGSFLVNGQLYIAGEAALYLFSNLKLVQLLSFPAGVEFQVKGIYEEAGSLVLATKDAGLYGYKGGQLIPIAGKLSELLQKYKLFSFEEVGENRLAFGTVLNGVYTARKDGEVINHINKSKGLLNNTLLCMHHGANGSLWMGLDFGIVSAHIEQNILYFIDYKGEYGTASSFEIKDGQLYIGTNQGLYKIPWTPQSGSNNQAFELIAGTEGQVWALVSTNDGMLVAHDKGLFEHSKSGLRKLSNEGVWCVSRANADILLAGKYNGISIFKYDAEGKLIFDKKMPNVSGSCNQLFFGKDGHLWVLIANFGVLELELDNNMAPIKQKIYKEGEFEGNNIRLGLENDELMVISDAMTYVFSTTSGKFEKKSPTPPINIKEKISGIYQPVLIENHYEFFPIQNGFALRDTKSDDFKITAKDTVLVRMLSAFNNDHKARLPYQVPVPYHLNNIRVDFLVPNQLGVTYQYRFGESGEWSQWQDKPFAEFLGLGEGSYDFQVRARSTRGTTDITKFSFSILPPWYRTWWAYLFYLLLVLVAYQLTKKYHRHKLKLQRVEMQRKGDESLKAQADQHQQELLLKEQEQIMADNSLIKHKLRSKIIELAQKARDNEDKKRLLSVIKAKLSEAQKKPNLAQLRLAEVTQLLDAHIDTKEDNVFEMQIDELHQDFFKKLKHKYPQLSIYDLRLCAYLKNGMNTPEIANILNVQPSSVYISRSRLRKKLGLSSDGDIYDFLMEI